MTNEELNDELQRDIQNSRGALREIIEHNRMINNKLVEDMTIGDFGSIEEYTMITDGILKSVKMLSEINSLTPKTIKEIQTIQEKKKTLSLSDLVDED